jgi:spore photoproduct lyase
MTVFCNSGDLFSEVDSFLEKHTREFFRIGTGEFTDSLLADYLAGYNRLLIPYFLKKDNAVLEIKSKLDCLEDLLSYKPKRKIIASWSLNTPGIISSEEKGSISLIKRIEAAARCQELGYLIGFHFDPMIFYQGCENEYKSTVERVFSRIDPSSVVWISLGTLRFMPSLKDIMIRVYPDSRLPYGEFIPGLDNKMRYVKTIRIEMYRKMASWIRKYAPGVLIYLCMESTEVWNKSLGFAPRNNIHFSRIMNERVKELLLPGITHRSA